MIKNAQSNQPLASNIKVEIITMQLLQSMNYFSPISPVKLWHLHGKTKLWI